MRQRITQKLADTIKPDSRRDIVISDEGLSGFRMKVTPKGRRIFFYAYRSPTGGQRKITFGRGNTLRVERARKLATEAAAKVRCGVDPQAASDAEAIAPDLPPLTGPVRMLVH